MYDAMPLSGTDSMRTLLRRAARTALSVVMLTALPSCGDAQRPPAQSRGDAAVRAAANCVVQRIVDGDTLVCEGDQRVRLLLIDTPELSQAPYGRQASRALQRLAPVGTRLRVETDVQFRDRYGRILGYLWTTDGRFINEEMVAAGMAMVLVYPPNVKYVDRLRAASAEARRKKVGLWATSAFECSPRDHRAGRC
jgi:micrococcal nuclease